jgi:hypothetical protein
MTSFSHLPTQTYKNDGLGPGARGEGPACRILPPSTSPPLATATAKSRHARITPIFPRPAADRRGGRDKLVNVATSGNVARGSLKEWLSLRG